MELRTFWIYSIVIETCNMERNQHKEDYLIDFNGIQLKIHWKMKKRELILSRTSPENIIAHLMIRKRLDNVVLCG